MFFGLWGLILVDNIDNFLRPLIYRRWANIHPLVTLTGALAGVQFFGLLGILIGPLALSYLFELIRMYRDEYIVVAAAPGGGPGPGDQAVPVSAPRMPPLPKAAPHAAAELSQPSSADDQAS